MKNLFDLQRFAAEAETAENAEAETAEAIPAELAGVSEDIAREAMQAAKAQAAADAGESAEVSAAAESTESAESAAAEPVEPAESAEDGNAAGAAEADSENKQYAPPQKIPYVRFKQELDKKKELEAQVKALSAQMDALKAQPQQPAPPQMQQAPQMQQPRITPEATKQLNALVQAQALQLTGFSKEDVDALSYMDDDDPRREQWKTAVDVARTQVIDGVYKMQQQRAAQAQQFMALHNAAVADYNAFAQKELLKKGSDVSPFPNDMDDWLLEYVNIRASMSNEFDIGQETQVMQNIITQVESMLHGLSPHGIQTEGYWNGAML